MSAINKKVLERFFEEIYNRGNLSVADDLVADTYISHNPALGEAPGREGLKAFVAYLRRAFADLHVTIEAQVAEGDRVATRFTIRGRQVGEFAGFPPTGKLVTVTATSMHRISHDRIQESWLDWDMLGLMQQLSAGQAGTPAN